MDTFCLGTSNTHIINLYFRHIIVLAQRGANLDIYEETLKNNYRPVSSEGIINCTLKRHDLFIQKFDLRNGDEYSRGERIEFNLTTQVQIVHNAIALDFFPISIHFQKLICERPTNMELSTKLEGNIHNSVF